MRLTTILLGLIICLFFVLNSHGQSKKAERKQTAKIKRRVNENTAEAYVFPKAFKHVYKKNTTKIMYGNSCATMATRKMGFEYVVRSNERISSKTNIGVFFNNLWVHSYLVVTRSPFWKVILNKRFKECKKVSGDLVG